MAVVVCERVIGAALPLSPCAFRDRDLDEDVVGGGVCGQDRSSCTVFWVEIESHGLFGVSLKNLLDS